MIVSDLIYVIPVVWIMASHLLLVVCSGCSLSICSYNSTVHVCNSTATTSIILGSFWIHKTIDSCYNQRLVLSCDPDCTRFTILGECLNDTIIDGEFPVIDFLHLTPWPNGKLWPLLVGEESIWIANVHTIHGFVISASSSVDPATTTNIYSNTASKSPSTISVSSSFINSIYIWVLWTSMFVLKKTACISG